WRQSGARASISLAARTFTAHGASSATIALASTAVLPTDRLTNRRTVALIAASVAASSSAINSGCFNQRYTDRSPQPAVLAASATDDADISATIARFCFAVSRLGVPISAIS